MILIAFNSIIHEFKKQQKNIAASSDAGSSAKWQNVIKIYIVEGQESDNKRAKLFHFGPPTMGCMVI